MCQDVGQPWMRGVQVNMSVQGRPRGYSIGEDIIKLSLKELHEMFSPASPASACQCSIVPVLPPCKFLIFFKRFTIRNKGPSPTASLKNPRWELLMMNICFVHSWEPLTRYWWMYLT